MAYWLYKSEPGTWSWDDHVRAQVTHWDGVRNFQAAANMRKAALGDRGFFYHSGDAREIVGVVEVVKTWYPDPDDGIGKFGLIDLKVVGPFPKPVTLAQVKQDPALKDMVLVKNSRLSVQPVTDAEWEHICRLGGFRG
jgi:predicted RNA-binding protein with PUA-like domain